MAAAWLQSHILDWVPLILVAQPYRKPPRPTIPLLPNDKEYRVAAKKRLSTRGESASSWLPRSRKAIAAEAEAIECGTRRQRDEVVEQVGQSYELFSNLDPALTMSVLQSAFADNGGTAAPIAVEESTLTVLMSFPPPDDSVWPETQPEAGGLTVKKRTKKEIRVTALMHMQHHIVATAKEAFGVQPLLDRVQIVAVREDPDRSLADLEVLALASFTSDQITQAFPHDPSDALRAWQNLINAYQTDDPETLSAVRRWLGGSQSVHASAKQAILFLLEWIQLSENTPLGTLRTALEGIDFETIDASNGSFEAPTGSIADNPLALEFPEFWLEALDVRTVYLEDSSGESGVAGDRTDDPHTPPILGHCSGCGHPMSSQAEKCMACGSAGGAAFVAGAVRLRE